MHIAIIDPEVDASLIKKYLNKAHTLFEYDVRYDPKNIDVLIIRSQVVVDKNLLDQHPSLTCIFRVGVGTEKIDLKACKAREILVFNTPGANASAVAELAIWALLEACRHPSTTIQDMKKQLIKERTNYIGTELHTHTIGFFGFGAVGKMIAKKLEGFDVQGMYYDPYVDGEYYHFTKEENKNTLFEVCDTIIIVAPLFPETKHTINKDTLEICKENVKILNMSRGGLVDETALLKFMKGHSHAFFFADVWEGEPQITNNLQALLALPNVLITNHIGSASQSAIERMHYFEFLR